MRFVLVYYTRADLQCGPCGAKLAEYDRERLTGGVRPLEGVKYVGHGVVRCPRCKAESYIPFVKLDEGRV